MKIAVTGVSGHIGSCLTRELLKNDDNQIRALIHSSRKGLEKQPLECIEGDLSNIESLEKLCHGTDVVFHLAAQIAIDRKSGKEVLKTNVEGTKNLLEVCFRQGVSRVIHFSSIHALDVKPSDQIMDESRNLILKTNRTYESSKAEGERIVLEFVKKGLNAIILNPTAVVGPFDYHRSYLGQALIKIFQNKLPVLVPGGYNWVDVRDVVQAAIASINRGRTGDRYILSGQWLNLKDLSEMISSISGHKTPHAVVPLFIAYLGLPFIRFISQWKGEHPLYTRDSLSILKEAHRNISNKKAKMELGFNPRPLSETLSDTFTWYKQQGLVV